MAVGNKVGHGGMSVGNLTDIDGPSSVATANGYGQRNALGYRVFDDNGNEYIYLAGVASTAAGDWVFYVPGAFTTTRVPASTATYGLLAVALAATLANCWGWYQIYGLTPANTAVASDAAADGKGLSAASGTIGQMKTAATTTKNVFNAVCVGAAASNTGTVGIAYPFEFGSSTI